MPDRMRAIEGDLEELVKRLNMIMSEYADDPQLAKKLDGLRNARELATRAIKLIQQARQAQL